MDPILGAAAIAGGAGIAGNVISGLFGKSTNDDNYKYAKRLAKQQHEYAVEKMKNAYQWSTEDMKKAGLNPALMYGDTAGATIAGGSGGSALNNENPGKGWANLGMQIASALDLNKQKAEIDNINADTENKNNQSGKTQADTILTLENVDKARAETMKIIEEAGLTKQQKENTKAELQRMYIEMDETAERIKVLQSQGKIAEVQAQFEKAVQIQRQITGYIDSVTGIINAVKGIPGIPFTSKSSSNNANWNYNAWDKGNTSGLRL